MAKQKKSKIAIKDIFRGKFLVDDDYVQNWSFILFFVVLAFISISSAHWVDTKVVRKNELETEVANLKAQYTDAHRELMSIEVDPKVIRMINRLGLTEGENQPYVLTENVEVND